MTAVAWQNIEHNWPVHAAGGEQVGKVFLVVGDENEDIFDGLAITHHGGPFVFHNYEDRPHYVTADQVASIDPGRVTLSISAEEAAHLPLPRSTGKREDRAGVREQTQTSRDLVRARDGTGPNRVEHVTGGCWFPVSFSRFAATRARRGSSGFAATTSTGATELGTPRRFDAGPG